MFHKKKKKKKNSGDPIAAFAGFPAESVLEKTTLYTRRGGARRMARARYEHSAGRCDAGPAAGSSSTIIVGAGTGWRCRRTS